MEDRRAECGAGVCVLELIGRSVGEVGRAAGGWDCVAGV